MKLLQKLTGNTVYYILRDMKQRYFPSENDKLIREKEHEAMPKRVALFRSFIQPGELCFDIGANMGNRIAPLLEAGARVVAAEPQPTCYEYLRYRFGDRIILVTQGLGSAPGIQRFHLANEPKLSTFSEEWLEQVRHGRFSNYRWNKTIEVEMTTLDKLIDTYGVPVFIKIDVEGFEPEVLKGLSRPIRMISFEYTAPEQLDNAVSCIERLQTIDPGITCNYSIGESMEMALPQWLNAAAMKACIRADSFPQRGFGDIYVRSEI